MFIHVRVEFFREGVLPLSLLIISVAIIAATTTVAATAATLAFPVELGTQIIGVVALGLSALLGVCHAKLAVEPITVSKFTTLRLRTTLCITVITTAKLVP